MLGSLSLTAFFALTVLLSMWLLLHVVKRTAPEWVPRVAIGLVAWLALTALTAMSGYADFDGTLPPRLLQLIVLTTIAALVLATTGFGNRLAEKAPVHLLVGLQTFRIMTSVFLYGGYLEGFVPWQLTWSGFNWDALVGMGALMISRLVKRNPKSRGAVWVWNVAGVLLLVNCIFVILLSLPTPFMPFEGKPDASFLTRSPYIWWPLFMMPLSAFGHMVLLRRLAAERAGKLPAEGASTAAAMAAGAAR